MADGPLGEVIVPELTPIKIAAMVHARHGYGKGALAEPIALSVDRRGKLTLVFATREGMEGWKRELHDPRPAQTWMKDHREAWQGGLPEHNGTSQRLIATTIIWRGEG